MKRYILRYGLIAGSISIALAMINWFLIAKTLGSGPSQLVGYLSIITSLLCVPLGIKYFKDKLNSGVVSFSQAIKIGTGITLVTAVVMFFYGMLFFVFAGDSFDAWKESGMTETQVQQARMQAAEMPDFIGTPLFQGVVMFLMVFLIGMIINLVSSSILKSK